MVTTYKYGTEIVVYISQFGLMNKKAHTNTHTHTECFDAEGVKGQGEGK